MDVLKTWGLVAILCVSLARVFAAEAANLTGYVHDETGGALPGVAVELRSGAAGRRTTVTDSVGAPRPDATSPCRRPIASASTPSCICP
jgi:hypothetical protein